MRTTLGTVVVSCLVLSACAGQPGDRGPRNPDTWTGRSASLTPPEGAAPCFSQGAIFHTQKH